MNIYFLVEGRRTEMRVYPAWLEHLLPHYGRVLFPDAVGTNDYFLISGEGYPQLLGDQLRSSIEDINACGRYAYFVICLDADEENLAARLAEVEEKVRASLPALDPSVTLKIIVQNRTIESWFMGNRKVISKVPNSRKLREFIAFYDVSEQCPESMGILEGYETHAEFHHSYLREIFAERKLAYSKHRPGHVCDEPYLNELIERTQERPSHLPTLQSFLSLCENVRNLTANSSREVLP